ncbi:C40 family peptidase [Streptomyces sp. BH-SS-21]|uniref:C40 family peptidase n=1 Tax=Streptomyces liliiviolaceus TaxID=2823109 RepID=A0A940Y2M3_9ACTN|nr:NlpC/P60 family protein [Streptomyces liliiviolaceus]MBQ0855467.1 C40 family peptidase [Streptomyces liliiviolaceus]
MKALAAGVAAVFLSPLLLAGTALVVATSSEAAHSSALDCLSDMDTAHVTEQVARILDGADASAVRVAGLDLPAEQIPHAQTIVATGISLDVPGRGRIIALATALQESRLRNLAYGDRDSLGLFQQRPSQNWGTAEQIRDPVHASQQFYKALLKVNGWQQMPLAQAAQSVQRSAYPDAYAQWELLATALQKAIAASLPDYNSNQTNKGNEELTAQAGCEGAEDGSSFTTIPEGTVPDGYAIPADTGPRARKAIVWAMHQLGTMYQWGGSCTAPRGPDPMGRCDCSSLIQQAYAHAGVPLTRTTYTQVREGTAVSPKAIKAGDLLFSRRSADRPEHVGMYLGKGLVIEAPRTGKPVRITAVKDWDVLAVRRVT